MSEPNEPPRYLSFTANGGPCVLREDVIGGWMVDTMNLACPPRTLILGPDGRPMANVEESPDEVTRRVLPEVQGAG